jgi:hypothetical protein
MAAVWGYAKAVRLLAELGTELDATSVIGETL